MEGGDWKAGESATGNRQPERTGYRLRDAGCGDGRGALPTGFVAAGVRCGLKQEGPDLALIFSERPATAAGVFTTNLFKAAPVALSQERLRGGRARAIVINAGNANAVTGRQGRRDAERMAALAAGALDVKADQVLVASTGIIGIRLPMDKVKAGIGNAAQALSPDGWGQAARAIMTTDTRPKLAEAELDGYRIAGICKGAGMICPQLATTIGVMVTDASVRPADLRAALSRAAPRSFGSITVDGDTSTNDSLFLLANGQGPPLRGAALARFRQALEQVAGELARAIAADGEGASKLVEITVRGGPSQDQARQIGRTVANSLLVKTAIFGGDPNWGRILAAAGRAGIPFDPGRVELWLGPVQVLRRGQPIEFNQTGAAEALSGSKVEIILDLHAGRGTATVWTCDLTYDYVRINAEYHT